MPERRSSSQPVVVTAEGDVLRIRIDRPAARNALSVQVLTMVRDALRSASGLAVRVVVIEGTAAAFSAGGDLIELTREPDSSVQALALSVEIVELIARLDRPVVAAVRGHAVGAGMGLALACDFVLASTTAVFTPSFVHVGLAPDTGLTYVLPRLIGPMRTKRMLMAGEPVPAATAVELGLVSEVWPDDEFERLLSGELARLAAGAPLAQAAIKRLVGESDRRDLGQQLAAEVREQSILNTTEDHRLAMRAFRERSSPEFHGR